MINFEFILIFFISLIFQIIFINKGLQIGKYFNVLDLPTKGKIHSKITPLIGSFPVVLTGFIYLIYFNFNYEQNFVLNIIFATAFVFFVIGYYDDRFNFNAYLKLFISTFIIVVVLALQDELTINVLYIESIDRHFYLEKIPSILFSTLCILLLINALNLCDGINGLASGFVAFWILLLSLFSVHQKDFLLFLSLYILINTFFIVKGKFFLGDSGTLFLGCLVSLVTIVNYNHNLFIGNLISIEKIFIFFMIPGLDMLRLFLERIRKKKDPFTRDLDHLHHMLFNIFKLYKTLFIYFVFFITSNFLSLSGIIKPIIVIILYLAIYILFISFYKKKFKYSS